MVLSWVLITPNLMLAITVIGNIMTNSTIVHPCILLGFTERKLDRYEGSDGVYEYPALVQVLAYMVEMSPVLLVIIVLIVQLVRYWRRGDIRSLFSADKWLPREDRDQEERGMENKNFEL